MVPEKYKAQMIAAVRRNEAGLDRDIRALENEMIKTMGNYGLKVNQLSPAQEQLWYDEIGRSIPQLVGTMFDRAVYGRIEGILRDHRNKRK